MLITVWVYDQLSGEKDNVNKTFERLGLNLGKRRDFWSHSGWVQKENVAWTLTYVLIHTVLSFQHP